MAVNLDFLQQLLDQEISEISDLLHRELEENSEKKQARENNYYLSKLIFEQPSLTPENYAKIMYEKHGMVRSSAVHNQLKTYNLYNEERRLRLVRIMKETSGRTYALLTGQSKNAFEDFDEAAKIIRARAFYERKVEGKVFLIAISSLINKELQHPINLSLRNLEDISRKGSYKLCREITRRLIEVIGASYNFEKRKTSTERVRDILEDVEATRDIEDMRATLIIMQKESQHLKEQFELEVKNYNDEFIKSFFTKLNSVRNGELLNSIAQTDHLIQDLKNQGWDMKPELQAIPTIIQIFINFLRSEGIQPIKSIGEILEIEDQELVNYEFVGTPKTSSGKNINVIVRTPGWRFGDIIFSHPRVEEVEQ